jgi:hypothetical protein
MIYHTARILINRMLTLEPTTHIKQEVIRPEMCQTENMLQEDM